MAAHKTTLHAVKADSTPPPSRRKPKTVTEAAEGGSHRDLLVAMRTRVAKAVQDPTTPARDLAALTRRLHEIAREIEQIDARDDEQGTEKNGPVEDEAFDAEAL